MKANGTVRESRILQSPLLQTQILNKTERGNFEHVVANSEIVMCKWHDNSVVTVTSNALKFFLNKVKKNLKLKKSI